MESLSGELAVSANVLTELWYFLAVAVLCFLFAVVVYWLARTSQKSVERMIKEERQTRARERNEDRAELKIMKTDIEKDVINVRFTMLQDFRRCADDIQRIDVEAREYLKSLANEFMAREEEREQTPETSSPIEVKPKIDGKKSLRRGLQIQKDFTNEYLLTHKDARYSLKKGEPDIVNPDNNGKVTEVVAVKSFELEITEKEKTCRNVKGHKYAVSITPSRDAIAEVETAKQNGLFKIRLVVFNLRTGHKIFDDLVLFNKKIKIREKKP